MLIEGAESGDSEAFGQAEALVKEYPEVAAVAVERGIKNAKNQYAKKALSDLLAKMKNSVD